MLDGEEHQQRRRVLLVRWTDPSFPHGYCTAATQDCGVYYFFVSDKEREKPLLKGITLELIYITSFNTTSEDFLDMDKKIPAELVKAIENMLLENMPSWYYSKQNLNSHL